MIKDKTVLFDEADNRRFPSRTLQEGDQTVKYPILFTKKETKNHLVKLSIRMQLIDLLMLLTCSPSTTTGSEDAFCAIDKFTCTNCGQLWLNAVLLLAFVVVQACKVK